MSPADIARVATGPRGVNDVRDTDEPVTPLDRKAVRLAIATHLAAHNSTLTHGGENMDRAVDHCYSVADMLIAKSGL